MKTLCHEPPLAQDSVVPKTVELCDRCCQPIARLPLSKGLEAIVHESDAIALGNVSFYADVNRTRKDGSQLIYARRRIDRHKAERLHEAIARLHGVDTKGFQVDHGNGNTLDNRWGCNLRVVTHAENVRNQPAQRQKAIAYKGVVKRGDYYAAQITIDGKRQPIGTFKNADEAAIAYNWHVLRLTGAIGRLNEINAAISEVA